MPGKAYITMLGRSTWALINSYYAVLREKKYYPDTIFAFTEDRYKDELEKASKGLEVLSENFGLKTTIQHEVIEEADFLSTGRRVSEIVKDLKGRGFEVAVDITPGRKALVAGALFSLSNIYVDHIFYLLISTVDDAAKPYMMIPLHIQQLKDFVEYTNKVKRE
jgi:hypothetical protein